MSFIDQSDAVAEPIAPQQPPRLALRIGVTGARALRAERIAGLRDHLQQALGTARETLIRLAEDPQVRAFYQAHEDDTPQAWLRFLSPLARGADRLAADVALSLGYDLFAAIPFARAEYEKDFSGAQSLAEPPLSAAEDLAQFTTLLKRAGDNGNAVFSLDGDRTGPDRAYEAVGRFIVRNSDVLIAIWDGGPSGGRGGTAEIVEYAALRGVPVLWIHATDDCPPVWIASREDLRRRKAAADALKALRASIERQILPPPAAAHHAHGLVARLSRLGQRKRLEPLKDYSWRDPKPPGAWARAYDVMMKLASRMMPAAPALQSSRAPDLAPARYWAARYALADARTGQYAARYRSAYVWLFVFATATLLFGASAAVAHGHEGVVIAAVLLEALMLALILLTVISAIRGDWHERFIEYRLLAELCRKQQVLGLLGRSVSLGAIHRMLQEGGAEAPAHGHQDRKAWVAWLFAAWERAAPLPTGSARTTLGPIVHEQISGGLIDTQLAYHRERAERSERADETFFKFGQWCFIAVCACVVLKLFVLTGTHHGEAAQDGWREALGEFVILALTWLSIVLPAVSAAAFGIRSYTELQLLTEQSRHMIAALEAAKRRIESIDVSQPLAIEDVGAETQAVAASMLQDIDGWSRLFKLKAIEP
ncbi:MAG TPA: hypothetical protein VL492_02715 [Methylovirgula sp.]|nr:hypothetical protein [Methylovirgula sp.]